MAHDPATILRNTFYLKQEIIPTLISIYNHKPHHVVDVFAATESAKDLHPIILNKKIVWSRISINQDKLDLIARRFQLHSWATDHNLLHVLYMDGICASDLRILLKGNPFILLHFDVTVEKCMEYFNVSEEAMRYGIALNYLMKNHTATIRQMQDEFKRRDTDYDEDYLKFDPSMGLVDIHPFRATQGDDHDPFTDTLIEDVQNLNSNWAERAAYLRMHNYILLLVEKEDLCETTRLVLRDAHIANIELPGLIDDIMQGRNAPE